MCFDCFHAYVDQNGDGFRFTIVTNWFKRKKRHLTLWMFWGVWNLIQYRFLVFCSHTNKLNTQAAKPVDPVHAAIVFDSMLERCFSQIITTLETTQEDVMCLVQLLPVAFDRATTRIVSWHYPRQWVNHFVVCTIALLVFIASVFWQNHFSRLGKNLKRNPSENHFPIRCVFSESFGNNVELGKHLLPMNLFSLDSLVVFVVKKLLWSQIRGDDRLITNPHVASTYLHVRRGGFVLRSVRLASLCGN